MRSSAGLFTLLILAGCASPPSKTTATDSEGQKIRVVEILNCNKLVHYVRPVYPKEAKRNRIHGTVTLRAVITKTGEVRDIEVLNASMCPGGSPLTPPVPRASLAQATAATLKPGRVLFISSSRSDRSDVARQA